MPPIVHWQHMPTWGPSSTKARRWQVLGVFVAVVVGVTTVIAIGYVLLRLAPNWLAQPEKLSSTQEALERGRIRTAALAYVLGVVAVIGAVFTALTFRLSRRGQGTDRFNKAIELLGNDKTNVRLGGIHALGQLARDDARAHHRAVLEVLVAYIRDRSPWAPQPIVAPKVPLWEVVATRLRTSSRNAMSPTRAGVPPDAAPDIKAAMLVLSRRKTTHDPIPLSIDLSDTNLRGVDASGMCLRGAVLSRTQLQDADLSGCDLRGAVLVGADLYNARLDSANLAGASLQYANLVRAQLRTAKGLATAKLDGAIHDRMTTDWPDPPFDPATLGALDGTTDSVRRHAQLGEVTSVSVDVGGARSGPR